MNNQSHLAKLFSNAIVAAALLLVGANAWAYGDRVQTVVMTNYTGRYIQFEFTDDSNHRVAWPGGDQAYSLPPHERAEKSLNCWRGQKICYGAWVKGDDNQYWGAGNDNSQHCDDCCFRCVGDAVKYNLREGQ